MDLSSSNKTMDDQHLKEEKRDPEIDQMASEIIKQNKIKMALLRKTLLSPANKSPVVQIPTPEISSEDSTSALGQFGWSEFAETCFPYIMRSGEKYVALRMLEIKIFPKYPSKEIAMCIDVDRFKLTKVEARLLNEINIQHTDSSFGSASFSEKEDIIHLKDAIDIYEFLEFCHKNLRQQGIIGKKRCGFVRLDGMFLPYVWWNSKRYAPLFYLAGEVKYLEENSLELKGWELAYLKLLCKVHNTSKSIQDQKSIRVVDLEIVKQCFVPGTSFEEMWPINNKIEALLGEPFSNAITENENKKNKSPQRETAHNAGKAPDVINRLMQPRNTPSLKCPNVNLFLPSTSASFQPGNSHVRFKITPKKRYEIRAPYNLKNRPMRNGYSNQAAVSVANRTLTVPQNVHTNPANCSNSNQAIVGVANQALTTQQSVLTNVTNSSIRSKRSVLMSCLPSHIIKQMQPVKTPNPTNRRMCILLQIPNFNIANNKVPYTLSAYQVENVTLKHSINIAPDDSSVLVTINEVLYSLVKVPYPILKQALDSLCFYVFLPNETQAGLLKSVGLLPGMGLVSGLDIKMCLKKLQMVCQFILRQMAPS